MRCRKRVCNGARAPQRGHPRHQPTARCASLRKCGRRASSTVAMYWWDIAQKKFRVPRDYGLREAAANVDIISPDWTLKRAAAPPRQRPRRRRRGPADDHGGGSLPCGAARRGGYGRDRRRGALGVPPRGRELHDRGTVAADGRWTRRGGSTRTWTSGSLAAETSGRARRRRPTGRERWKQLYMGVVHLPVRPRVPRVGGGANGRLAGGGAEPGGGRNGAAGPVGAPTGGGGGVAAATTTTTAAGGGKEGRIIGW